MLNFFVASTIATPSLSLADDDPLSLLVDAVAATEQDSVRAALLSGIVEGLEGSRDVPAPNGWDALRAKLGNSENAAIRQAVDRLSQVFGDADATQRAIELLRDSAADPALRKRALADLLGQQNRQVSVLLESLIDDPELGTFAIRGYAVIENAAAPSVLLSRFGSMNPKTQRVVVETLASRRRYASELVGAMEAGRVSHDRIPVHVARSLQSLVGDRFTKVYGEIRPIAGDREALITKYKALLTPQRIAKADANAGRVVFQKTCAACHLMFGEGGKVGPDLTGSNRANLDYLLLNSIDPSYDVPQGYQMVSVLTEDGRVISGVVAEEDSTRLILKTAEQPRVVVLKTDIQQRKVSPKSIMPEGQLQSLKQQEVVDLVKYMQLPNQVEPKK